MPDFLHLQTAVPRPSLCLPAELRAVRSPLFDHLDAWQAALGVHPDELFATYILIGIQYGFRIGFSCRQHLASAIHNSPLAT